MYKNNIIDVTHFKSRKASPLEKSTYDKYKNKSKKIVADMKKHLATDYTKGSKDLSDDMNDFLDYFYKQLKDDNIVLVNQVDTSDSVYKKFAKGKTSLSRFLQYAISKQWIDQEKLDIKSGYYTSEEIYKKLLDYGFKKLKDDTGFAKLIYGYLVQHYELSGTDTCLLLMDQKAVKKSKTDYTNLQSGALSPYSYIIKQIKKLEITPGDLGLEPCSGSIVVTDVATTFNEKIGVDGVILTKLDGDTRGGAALSIRAVTGKPILYVGMGEKLSDLEQFYPDRMASRILGMGDVLTLIEKAEAEIDQDKAKEMERKFRKAEFDFNDFLDQMAQMKKMGGIQSILSMLPGMGLPADLEIDDNIFKGIEAIIYSMTPEERGNPAIINPSRKRRIAKGAGVNIAEVNKLMKQYEQSKKMMKQMSGMMGGKGKKKGKFSMPKLPFGF